MKLHESQTKQLLADFGLMSPSWGIGVVIAQSPHLIGATMRKALANHIRPRAAE